MNELFEEDIHQTNHLGAPSHTIGIVSGSDSARRFWQEQLNQSKDEFRAKSAYAFHEDLPVNQAFGILLLWQRLKPRLAPDQRALVAFVFGDGTRSTPFTESECGQKPAISTFVRSRSKYRPFRSTVELALRTFAPVEAYLTRSGFRGIVIKWGDEVQIPTRSLLGSDPLFRDADIVRFVSVQAITEDTAKNKDWMAVDEQNHIRGFIPRRPLEDMYQLASEGLFTQRQNQLVGGINLGSIAISHALLDQLLYEFKDDVNDPTADRRNRPDLDPQLFTALVIATIEDPTRRFSAWNKACQESPMLKKLSTHMPQTLERLVRVLSRFSEQHKRPIKIVAMDFGDQYWGDVGQHQSMYSFFMNLANNGPNGKVARALANLPETRDKNGNILAGTTVLGSTVQAKNSIFIDAHIERGKIEDSVLIGTTAGAVNANSAFDVESTTLALNLSERSGSYKVVSKNIIDLPAGTRATTLFLPEKDSLFMIKEDMPLKGNHSVYQKAVLDNLISFNEAHQVVTQADPQATEETRRTKRQEIEVAIDKSNT